MCIMCNMVEVHTKLIAHPQPAITTKMKTIQVNNECVLITSKSLIIIGVMAMKTTNKVLFGTILP